MEAQKLKERTRTEYIMYLQKLMIFNNLNQESVRLFINTHHNNVARAFLKNFISYLKFNPDVAEASEIDLLEVGKIELPKITGTQKRKIPDTLTEEEVMKIHNELPNEKLRLMLLLQYYGAMRVQELVGIKLSNINFEDWSKNPKDYGEIKVKGKGDKEGLSLIPPSVMMRLYEFIRDSKMIALKKDEIEKPIWKKMKTRRWAEHLEDASFRGIKRKINTHLLRHSKATDLFNKGMDIMTIKEFLRHSNIQSTQVYLHLSKEKIKKDLLALEN